MRTLTQIQADLDIAYEARTALIRRSLESMGINGRALQYAKIQSLTDVINALERDLAAVQSANRGSASLVSFGRPCQ